MPYFITFGKTLITKKKLIHVPKSYLLHQNFGMGLKRNWTHILNQKALQMLKISYNFNYNFFMSNIGNIFMCTFMQIAISYNNKKDIVAQT